MYHIDNKKMSNISKPNEKKLKKCLKKVGVPKNIFIDDQLKISKIQLAGQ